MKNVALLIGNGVNAMSAGISWEDLLDRIIQRCKTPSIVKDKGKPFPLFYEDIFFAALKSRAIQKEVDLKSFIGEQVSNIQENDVHKAIRRLKPAHIMTLNYEFLLAGGCLPVANEGIVQEKLYSIFRKYTLDKITYWHLHGDCRYPMSINLGYEHYGGQLQQMRNYVASGTNYTTQGKGLEKLPLIRRLQNSKKQPIQSWIDLFFLKDIHIMGATLDFVETDLWWLLTYRARQIHLNQKVRITNKLYYYIPKKYAAASRFKLDLLKANGVIVKEINLPHSVAYYKKILAGI